MSNSRESYETGIDSNFHSLQIEKSDEASPPPPPSFSGL